MRSAVLWWALGGAFLLATFVYPRRWLEMGLADALLLTLALIVIGAAAGAALAVLRSWFAQRSRTD